jgi:zinc finger CCCH domain-containing protein 13
VKASVEAPSEGKDETTGSAQPVSEAVQADAPQEADNLTEAAENEPNKSSNLNHIQTIETIETDSQDYDQSMTDDVMQYNSQLINQFPRQPSHMSGAYDNTMGYHQNNFGHRGGFNHAYGAATVLTGEPRGVGVEGAPTGPRAMREGRPNTGFSSRANNARFNAPPPSVTPSQDAVPASPVRNVRS